MIIIIGSVIIIIGIFPSYSQNIVFDIRKKRYKLPEMGEGGEVIQAMPERKHSFLQEVFPNTKKEKKVDSIAVSLFTNIRE